MAEKKKVEVEEEPVAEKPAKKKAAPKAKKAEPAEKPVKESKKDDAKAAKKAAKEEAKAAKKKAKEAPVEEAPKRDSATCFVRDIRITPRKVRLVADLVRGLGVNEALALLNETPRVGAKPVAKAIQSAAANATNNFGMQRNLLYVSEIQVSDGLKIKRYIPRAKGSASGIIKRNANLRVSVAERK